MTRRWLRWLLLLSCSVSLHAQTGASISGTVVDDQGKPMRRVSVVFEGDTRTNRTAITDDLGRFGVTAMPAARYEIRAEKGAYPPVNYGAKRPGRPGAGLTVKDGDRIENIVLRMARGAVIAGRVLDEKGRPVTGAGVVVYRILTRLGGEVELQTVSRSSAGAVLSDDRGVYRVYGLAADEYIVGVQSFRTGQADAARRPSDAELREAFGQVAQRSSRAISTDPRPALAGAERPLVNLAPMFYGDTVDPLASTRVRLAAGEERADVDLHLPWQPRATISVIVQGPDATPPTVEFEVRPRAAVGGLTQMLVRPGVTGGRASFSNQTPGDYVVIARTIGATPPQWGEAAVTIVDRDVTDVRIELRPALSLTGRVVFQGSALPPPDPARARVVTSPTRRTGRNPSAGAAMNADGSFALRDVQPGEFRLGVSLPSTAKPGEPFWTMTSVVMGDRDVTDLPIVIADGQPLPEFIVTFTDTPSELSGRIVLADGKAGNDVFVVALPSDERYWIYGTRRIKSTRPDASGRYTFSGLPPGTYRIAAVTELDQGDLQNQTFLRELAASSAEVSVAVGEKKTFDLKLGGAQQRFTGTTTLLTVDAAVAGPLTGVFGFVDGSGALLSGPRALERPSGGGDYRAEFLVPVSGGTNRLRFAVADANGAVGSIEVKVTAKKPF